MGAELVVARCRFFEKIVSNLRKIGGDTIMVKDSITNVSDSLPGITLNYILVCGIDLLESYLTVSWVYCPSSLGVIFKSNTLFFTCFSFPQSSLLSRNRVT